MARYATYPSVSPPPLTRKWLLRALFLSLLVHLGFFAFAYRTQLDRFSFTNDGRLAPPQFVVKQVSVDPKLLDQPEEVRATMAASKTPTPIDLKMEKPEPKEIQISPTATASDTPLLVEDSKPKAINWENLVKADVNSAGSDEKKVGEIAAAILKETAPAKNQRSIKVPKLDRGGDGSGGAEGIPGLQSLDAALARTGALPAGENVGLKGGALFDYDSADLRRDALDEMQKLGELIQRNPKAVFRIEGHTDAIGSREYNLVLSQRRADNMKQWLVANLHIDPSRIETVGLGPDKLIIPADRSIEEQQPNRRVEIVIKTNRAK